MRTPGGQGQAEEGRMLSRLAPRAQTDGMSTGMSRGSRALTESAAVWSLLAQAGTKLSLKGLPVE